MLLASHETEKTENDLPILPKLKVQKAKTSNLNGTQSAQQINEK